LFYYCGLVANFFTPAFGKDSVYANGKSGKGTRIAAVPVGSIKPNDLIVKVVFFSRPII